MREGGERLQEQMAETQARLQNLNRSYSEVPIVKLCLLVGIIWIFATGRGPAFLHSIRNFLVQFSPQ